MKLLKQKKLFPFALLMLMLLLSVGIDAQRPRKNGKKVETDSTLVLSGVPADTIVSDSIRADSIANDTIVRKESPIEAPVKYKANDSIVFTVGGNAYLYGEGKVNYQNIELTSAQISMNLDSSVVHAVGKVDSTGVLSGTPVFKEGETPYESEVMSYNFKSKKGFIHSITTQQGEGYVTSENAKKDADDIIYMRSGRYTTCDNHDHPHFYLALSMAKVKVKKNVVFGPATLVVEDVHLPIAIPFGFFPFNSSYSSGFIMPTYGDEMNRGFYLRDGGYYFAINDNVDLKLLGEIFTKGSWGLSAASNYNKRYKYAGSFNASYLVTKTGEKNIPEDYSETKDFKIAWSHRQDAKANPNSTFSASVNFATSSYDQRNLSSLYNPQQFSQNTKASSVSYSRTFQEIGLNLSSTFNLTQNTRDSSISMTLPDLNIALNRLYPFKRKKAAGTERWYEKISLQYTGNVTNSISTKENLLMSTPLTQWKNGFQHTIPVSATFTLFNYLNVVPSVNYVSRWYMNRYEQSYDTSTHTVRKDTINGFNRVWNYNLSLQMNTKLYGFYKPWKMFGEKVQMIRHLITPSVSFSYAPDFGSARYGYYKTFVYTDEKGEVRQVEYSPYEGMAYGVPGRGLSENINFSLDNNVEMKIKSDKDTTGIRKISLIDQLSANISYNAAAKTQPWSDLSMSLRLKLTKSYTFNMNASFATYAYQYDEKGNIIVGDRTEWSYGRFGRFQGYSGSFSYSLNNDTFKKLFRGGDDTKDKEKKKKNEDEEDDEDEEEEQKKEDNSGLRRTEAASLSSDGYLAFKMPWSINLSYSYSIRENKDPKKFNRKSMRYPYAITHSLNISGNLNLGSRWSTNYSSGYDFNTHEMSMTTVNISRDMHCFEMSCGLVFGPVTSYNFSIRAKSNMLTDALKWDQRSNTGSAVTWY